MFRISSVLTSVGTVPCAAPMNITASGGVSSLEDVIALRKLNLYGAIIGKAWYTGTVSLKEAVERAK